MKRNSFYDMLIMAALMGGDSMSSDRRGVGDIERKRPEPPQPKGLTRFDIDGKEVWAINRKNAVRKAKKL